MKLYRVCLPADELERMVRFYAYLLHQDGDRLTPTLHQFRVGDIVLALQDLKAEGLPAAPPHNAPLYIAVEDRIEAVHQRVAALGARHVDPEVRRLPSGEMGFFARDPGGNRLAIVDERTRSLGAAVTPKPAAAAAPVPGEAVALHRDFLNRVKGGNLMLVEEMLMLDPDLAAMRDGTGVSALMHAAYKKHFHVAARLAAITGRLDLWEACALGRDDLAARNLDAEPDALNRPAPDGFVPLGLACYFGRDACVALLLARGADANAESANARRLRPLHSAVSHGDVATAVTIARRLIAAGADVNAQEGHGYTPLHLAADAGAAVLVNLLLQAGARSDLPAANGRTALSLALARGHASVSGMLRAHERATAQPATVS